MKRLPLWLGATAILTVIFGTVYLVTLQMQRDDANYPQIQMAEDAAAALNQGAKPASLIASSVNMNTSLESFVVIYNKSGQAIAGSGYLNGRLPAAPYGILADAQGREYHWVSWQPQTTVRIVAVTVAADNYYVLSGRSLREVEKNESQALQISFTGGVVSWLILSAMIWYSKPVKR